ncbi:MAG: glycoside hydrolase family 42 [Ignisphaera sp.]
MRTYRCGSYICTDNGFRFLLGVNYWPRKLNIRMWRDWDEDAVKEDVNIMKRLGVRVVRIFLKDEDFADEDGNLVGSSLEKLNRFLDILEENGIQAFVTFIVGHMSGKNWRIPWTSFEDLYTSRSIEKTIRFIEAVVMKIKDHKAVAGWILSNELSLVNKARNREEALATLRAFSYTIKNIDKDHVLSSGDVPDSYMQETHNVKKLVDYVGPHLYLYDNDPIRHSHLYAALIELFSNGSTHPVILEEFGFSTHQFSEDTQAKFIYEILYTSLIHGASGAFVWCFSDFVNETDPPYEWRPLELGFGLVKSDGSEKKAAEMFKRFAEEVEKLESLGINSVFRRTVDVYLVAPFYLWRDYEFIWYRDALGFFNIVKPLVSAYVMLTASGLSTSIVYELDVDSVLEKAKLLLLPSTIAALASTWRKLYSYVERGGHLYASFVRGLSYIMALHDSPTHLWQELFGVENMLEAGSIGRKIQNILVLEFVKDFGSIKKGDKLSLEVSTPIYVFKARPIDAEVIAYDHYGEPIVFEARRGRGRAYLSLIPIEALLANSEEINWASNIHRFYESLGLEANISRLYIARDPRIEIQIFSTSLTDVDRDILVAINHSYRDIETSILSTYGLKHVEKIGGNASLKNFNDKEIEALFYGKSVLTLLITRTKSRQ